MLKGVLILQINKYIQSASYLNSSYVGLLLPEARKGQKVRRNLLSKQKEEIIESKPRLLLLIIKKLVVYQQCVC